MKISVIVPTYKPQNYFWKCLESIYSQTFSKEDFEVIISLNGCKEPYFSEINNFKKNHSDVKWKFLQTDEPGVSNARNIAIDVAQGEFITFIDDDDLVSECYLEELYSIANKKTVSICYPFAFNDGAENVQLFYSITENFKKNKNRKNISISDARKFFSGPCMKLIHKGIIKNRRFDKKFKNGEDSLFMFLISDEIKNVKLTSEKCIYYRRYRELSATTSAKSFMQVARNSLKLIIAYNRIFWRNPLKYDFVFYLTRILGALNTILKKG